MSRLRQLVTLYHATYRYNFPPSLYYRARLFRLPRNRWLSIFSHGEVIAIVPLIEQRSEHLDIWSKQGWHRFCARHHLPRVPTFASVVNGQLCVTEDPRALAGRDLFIKPDRGWASRGTILLEWRSDKAGWQAIGAYTEIVPLNGLSRCLLLASGGADIILQPRLRTHPDLVDLSPRALANVRVVTIRSPNGRLSVFSAALRIPGHEEHCSDVADGFFVPVDTNNGCLGYAEGLDMAPGPLSSHPVTGVQIHGRIISQWPEMRLHALAAHALLPSVRAIGWDLVPTESGVLILEANVAWSTNLTQLRGLAPLGESDWPVAILACLDDAHSTPPPPEHVPPANAAR